MPIRYAELMGEITGLPPLPIAEMGPPALTPPRKPLREARVMIVGHEPLFSAVYAYLLGAASVQIDVKKGSLGRVDVNRFSGQPRGVLRWLIYPKLAGE